MSVFHFQDSVTRSTVVRRKDGSVVEVRRGDFTWSAANRAAHPEIVQRVWPSLAAWHADLPVGSDHPVTIWKDTPSPEGGFRLPLIIPQTEETVYSLGPHLSWFMFERKVATEKELVAAIKDFRSDYWNLDKHYNITPFLTFLLGDPNVKKERILEALQNTGHILPTCRCCKCEVKMVSLESETPVYPEKVLNKADSSDAVEGEDVVEEDAVEEDAVEEDENRTVVEDGVCDEDEDKDAVPVVYTSAEFQMLKEVAKKVYSLYSNKDNATDFRQTIIQQCVLHWLNPRFEKAWRSDAFQLILMRTYVLHWLADHLIKESAPVRNTLNLFLEKYPL